MMEEFREHPLTTVAAMELEKRLTLKMATLIFQNKLFEILL